MIKKTLMCVFIWVRPVTLCVSRRCASCVLSSGRNSSLWCALRAAVSRRFWIVCIPTRIECYWPLRSRERLKALLHLSPRSLPLTFATDFPPGGHRARRWKHYRRGEACLPSLSLSEGQGPRRRPPAPLARALTRGTMSSRPRSRPPQTPNCCLLLVLETP